MNTENKEGIDESYPIWGWILAIVGGLLTLLGIGVAIFLNFHAHQNVVIGFFICSVPFLVGGVLLIILGIRWKNREKKRELQSYWVVGELLCLYWRG